MDIQEREIDIECPLISKSRNEESKNKRKCDDFLEEVMKILALAGPLMSVNFLLYCLQVGVSDERVRLNLNGLK